VRTTYGNKELAVFIAFTIGYRLRSFGLPAAGHPAARLVS
jgi:hypothetical protein